MGGMCDELRYRHLGYFCIHQLDMVQIEMNDSRPGLANVLQAAAEGLLLKLGKP